MSAQSRVAPAVHSGLEDELNEHAPPRKSTRLNFFDPSTTDLKRIFSFPFTYGAIGTCDERDPVPQGPVRRVAASECVAGAFALIEHGGYVDASTLRNKATACEEQNAVAVIVVVKPSESHADRAITDSSATLARGAAGARQRPALDHRLSIPVLYIDHARGNKLLTHLRSERKEAVASLGILSAHNGARGAAAQKGGARAPVGWFGRAVEYVASSLAPLSRLGTGPSPAALLATIINQADERITATELALALDFLNRWCSEGLALPAGEVVLALNARSVNATLGGDPALLIIAARFQKLLPELTNHADVKSKDVRAWSGQIARAVWNCLESSDFAQLLAAALWGARARESAAAQTLLPEHVFELERFVDEHPYAVEWLGDGVSACLDAGTARGTESKRAAVLLSAALWARAVCYSRGPAGVGWPAMPPLDEDDVEVWASQMLKNGVHFDVEGASLLLEAVARHVAQPTLNAIALSLPQSLYCFCYASSRFVRDASEQLATQRLRDLVLSAAAAGALDGEALAAALVAAQQLGLGGAGTEELARRLVERASSRRPREERLSCLYDMLDAIARLHAADGARAQLLDVLLRESSERAAFLSVVSIMLNVVQQVARTAGHPLCLAHASPWLARVVHDAPRLHGNGASAAPEGSFDDWFQFASAVLALMRDGRVELQRAEHDVVRALLYEACDEHVRRLRLDSSDNAVRARRAGALLRELLRAASAYALTAPVAESSAAMRTLARNLLDLLAQVGALAELGHARALSELAAAVGAGVPDDALHAALFAGVVERVVALRRGEPCNEILSFAAQLLDPRSMAVRGSAGATAGARGFARAVLERHCAQPWWPADFETAVLRVDQRVLGWLGKLATFDPPQAFVARWRRLLDAAAAWSGALSAQRVTFEDLERIHARPAYAELQRCARSADGAPLLPDADALRARLAEIAHARDELVRECSLGASAPVGTMTHGSALTVWTILDRYVVQLPDALARTAARMRVDAEWWRAVTWAELVADAHAVRVWRCEHEPQLAALEHFASRQSALFHDQLRLLRADELREDEAWDASAFFEAIDAALAALARLVERDGASFADVRASAGAVTAARAERELRVIVEWPPLARFAAGVDECVENMRTVLALLDLRAPLGALVNCLEQYAFSCAAAEDHDFAFVRALSARLDDERAMASRPMAECRNDLRRAMQLLRGDCADDAGDAGDAVGADCEDGTAGAADAFDPARAESAPSVAAAADGAAAHTDGNDAHPDDSLCSDAALARAARHLALFAALSSATNVWDFVRDKGWHGKEGFGELFRLEYANVTNLLQGEDYETTVLNQLDRAVECVATAMQARELPFEQLMRSLLSAPVVRAGAAVGFSELGEVQANIVRVRAWFTRGLGDVEGVFDEMSSVLDRGVWAFSREQGGSRADAAALSLALLRDGHDSLRGAQLDDFVRMLCFVQRDDKGAGFRIDEVLSEYNAYGKALDAMRELVALGHPLLDGGSIERRVLRVPRDAAAGWADELRREMSTWLSDLAHVRAQHSLLLLLSTAEARSLHGRLAAATTTATGAAAFGAAAAHMLPRLVGTVGGSSARTRDAIAAFARQYARAHPLSTSTAWPAPVGSFLSALRRALGSPPLPLRAGALTACAGLVGVYVHVLDNAPPELLLRLLVHIFAGRAPEAFEMLVCSKDTRPSDLHLFFQRVRVHTRRTYALVHVDALSSACQDDVTAFLLDRVRESEELRLHCVVDGPSMLQPAPWIRITHWNVASAASALPARQAAARQYTAAIVDGTCIRSVRVFASSVPGAGKTHLARKQLQLLRADTLVVCLSEAFDAADVSRLLAAHEARQHSVTDTRSAVFFQVQMGHFATLDGLAAALRPIAAFLYDLLVLRLVGGGGSEPPFALPSDAGWDVFVEVPSLVGHAADAAGVNQAAWYAEHALPLLWLVGTIVEPPAEFEVDERVRRVCKYLRAYSDGTINRKFGDGAPASKHVLLLLDVSGSMQGEKLDAAVDNMLAIFDGHMRAGDRLSLLVFDHAVRNVLSAVDDLGAGTRAALGGARNLCQGGGTDMYAAISAAADLALANPTDGESWIICLTDGESIGDVNAATTRLQRMERLHLAIIGVALAAHLVPRMTALCTPRADSKGQFIAAGESAHALGAAFATAVSLLPVSQTFDLDPRLADSECRAWLARYMPEHVRAPVKGLLLQTFWVKYLHRRVLALDESVEFNYNREHEQLGSTLMEVMLFEVDSALREGQERSWRSEAHRQLIYDFSHPDGPKFAIFATSPELIDAESRARLSSLGFALPSAAELATRDCLDASLARALSLQLDERGRLGCIDEFGFVLTLDFAVKLLHIHERVACGVPCVMEGETGVSKTALTRMYALLLTASCRELARTAARTELGQVDSALSMRWPGLCLENMPSGAPLECAVCAAEMLLGMAERLASPRRAAPPELLAAARAELDALRAPLGEAEGSQSSGEMTVLDGRALEATRSLLAFLREAAVIECFFAINVHAALTPADIRVQLQPARDAARALRTVRAERSPPVVVFLDEVNTSSCMGVFKALVLDRSLDGERLEDNIVVIAACNPKRTLAIGSAGVLRQDDLGRDWALGHYQVSALPGSLDAIKWRYGALGEEQERDFVACRLEQELTRAARGRGARAAAGAGVGAAAGAGAHGGGEGGAHMASLVCACMRLMRAFSEEHLRERIWLACPRLTRAVVAAEAAERAKTAVSLRDVQRVLVFRRFFAAESGELCAARPDAARRALLLALACVFYVRLDRPFRKRLLDTLREQPAEQLEHLTLDVALADAMERVLSNSDLPRGIARTEGLMENCFMALVCTLARVPLMIVGPPGSSKTLSVGVVETNARGEESRRAFFRPFERVEVFSYQCSRRSTSSDIETVFRRAIERQGANRGRARCVVFMDEAGLPDERRESLKVLHYYLEGASPARDTPDVSFIAITNHVLDAAKSNRCACLLRGEPDSDDLERIARGCLLELGKASAAVSSVASADAAEPLVGPLGAAGAPMLSQPVAGLPVECGTLTIGEFVRRLCAAYTSLLKDKERNGFDWFERAFGLRDFIHTLRMLRRRSEAGPTGFRTSRDALLVALSRNFGGVSPERFRAVVSAFVTQLFGGRVAREWVPSLLPDVVRVLDEAIADCAVGEDAPRYVLLIDESADESALRLPRWHGLATPARTTALVAGSAAAQVLKLSDFSDDMERRQVSLISAVKLGAAQGAYVELSGSEPVHESLYALFNQQFKEIVSKDGTVRRYANIAVGSYSKPCLVSASFRCALHLPVAQLADAPAAFLNRFEKHRLRVVDVLRARLARVPPGLAAAMLDARRTATAFAEELAAPGWLGGLVEQQTVDSVILDMLPRLDGLAPPIAPTAPVLDEALSGFASAASDGGALLLCAEAVDGARAHLTLRSSAALDELALDGLASAASWGGHALAGEWRRLTAAGAPAQEWRALVQCAIATADADARAGGADADRARDEPRGGIDGGGEAEEVPLAALSVARAALRHVLEREACERLLLLAPPEALLSARPALPPTLVRAYFESQEHFSLPRLVERAREAGGLHAVHARTTPAVHRLRDRRASGAADARPACGALGLPADVAVACLAHFPSEEAFREVVREWASAPGAPCLLLVADLAATSPERVTFARVVAEQCLVDARASSHGRHADDGHAEDGRNADEGPTRDEIGGGGGGARSASERTLVLLLHAPASRLGARAQRHPALFHAGWTHCALDGVGGEPDALDARVDGASADARDAREWCALACDLRREWDVTPCLRACAGAALRVASKRVRVRAPAAVDADADADADADTRPVELSLPERQRLVESFMRQEVPSMGGASVCELVCRRFAREWDHDSIELEVTTAAERLASGQLGVALGEEVGSALEATFCNFCAWLLHQLSADGSLLAHERQGRAPDGTGACSVELLRELLDLLRMPPLAELRLRVHSYALPPPHAVVASATLAADGVHVPLFAIVRAALDLAVDEAIGAVAPRADPDGALSGARDAWPQPAAIDAEARRASDAAGEHDATRTLVRWACARAACDAPFWETYVRQLVAHTAVLEPIPARALCAVIDVLVRCLEARLPAAPARSLVALHAAERAARAELLALVAVLAPIAQCCPDLGEAWARRAHGGSAEARAVDVAVRALRASLDAIVARAEPAGEAEVPSRECTAKLRSWSADCARLLRELPALLPPAERSAASGAAHVGGRARAGAERDGRGGGGASGVCSQLDALATLARVCAHGTPAHAREAVARLEARGARNHSLKAALDEVSELPAPAKATARDALVLWYLAPWRLAHRPPTAGEDVRCALAATGEPRALGRAETAAGSASDAGGILAEGGWHSSVEHGWRIALVGRALEPLDEDEGGWRPLGLSVDAVNCAEALLAETPDAPRTLSVGYVPDWLQVPPTDGGVPPTDGEVPPTDGGVPPTDGGVPPTDGGVPPTDGEVPPTDGGCEQPWPLADAVFCALLKRLLVRYGRQPLDQLVSLLALRPARPRATESPAVGGGDAALEGAGASAVGVDAGGASGVFDAVYTAAAEIFFLSRFAREAAMRASVGAGGAAADGGATAGPSAGVRREPVARLSGTAWVGARDAASRLLAARPELQRFALTLILRSHGQAAVEAALTSRDAFGCGSAWADEWRKQLLPPGEANVDALARAARMAALNARIVELHAAEDEKALTLRCCPACGRVTQRTEGCNTMECGRDAHTDAPIHPTVGCGARYDWQFARPYTKDTHALDALRAEVERAYERAAASERFWRELADWRLPHAFVAVMDAGGPEDALPTAALASALERAVDGGGARAPGAAVALRFLGVRRELRALRALPALVRLYLWLDSHFASLLTRARAAELTLGEVFGEAQLRSRFSASEARDARALWARARDGFNEHVRAEAGRLRHGACGAVNELTELTDDTRLLHVLSDGATLADGNDAILAVIAALVARHNDAIDAITRASPSTARAPLAVHPAAVSWRTLLSGDLLPHELGGARAGASTAFERDVEQFWRPRSCDFDLDALNAHIADQFVVRCRAIGDPDTQLRSRFRFRADAKGEGVGASVGADEAAALVAAVEDACAAGACACGMPVFTPEGLAREATARRPALHAVLHAAPYSQLRALLHGAKMLADIFAEVAVGLVRAPPHARRAADGGGSGAAGGAVGGAVSGAAGGAGGGEGWAAAPDRWTTRSILERSAAAGGGGGAGGGTPGACARAVRAPTDLLSMLELAQLDGAAAELVLSLRAPAELCAFARFLEAQLVSRAYDFAHLPLGVKQPLPAPVEAHMRTQRLRAARHRAVRGAAEEVEAALGFAERDYAGASDLTRPLGAYLLSVCGLERDGEAIARLVPAGARLQHVVALRVQLRELARHAAGFEDDARGAPAAADDAGAQLAWAWAPSVLDPDRARAEPSAAQGARGAPRARGGRLCLWFEAMAVHTGGGWSQDAARREAAIVISREWRARWRSRAATRAEAAATSAASAADGVRGALALATASPAADGEFNAAAPAVGEAAELAWVHVAGIDGATSTRPALGTTDAFRLATTDGAGKQLGLLIALWPALRLRAWPAIASLRERAERCAAPPIVLALVVLAAAAICAPIDLRDAVAVDVRSLCVAAAVCATAMAVAAAIHAWARDTPLTVAAWVARHALPLDLAARLRTVIGVRTLRDVLLLDEADVATLALLPLDRRKWETAVAELRRSSLARQR